MENNALIYYQQQAKGFGAYVESVLKGIKAFLAQNEDQLNLQQKAELRAITSLYMGTLVEDIQRDLFSNTVTIDTIEKRVELEVETFKIVKRILPLDLFTSVFLDCLFSIYLGRFRDNLVSWRRIINESQGRSDRFGE